MHKDKKTLSWQGGHETNNRISHGQGIKTSKFN